MKSVLTSIQSKWCELIVIGAKTIEVRKTVPNIDTPFKSYIYCTKAKNPTEYIWITADKKLLGNGKVIGEFICDSIKEFGFTPYNHGEYVGIDDLAYKSCLSFEDLYEYIGDGYGYGWHISDLKIYDKPKELNEFYNLRKCYACDFGEIPSACNYDDHCIIPTPITRPPQSWCYVEEIT